ncbi:RNA polymerase sigma-70 factor [Zobellia galactanivorans]|uniref:RNA polymerase sigma-70 factor n=1 Tax=Zobellia galactanivorans (strain DSM 12802 / CCUG 47099 / CIP 106680 / NCIMB 13871 / Dsij) TaxID=63186 RepID=UPI001C0750A3|nr:RNA polymerase sigma-70 factor [Zobellia galactanivorans]MBU3026331.1 RNA polymerase sigma-70 factor [Zobellia galactanivorans]MDO6807674.1 RNA polymerase sigma-70 factor [Zobellia galactanivorans]
MSKKSHNNDLLLTCFRSGNQKAFKTLFDRYWEPMFVKANIILQDSAVAQDVVQDIWINLWNKREQLEIKNFESYISHSVRYGCYKYLRDSKFTVVQLQIIDSLPLATTDIDNLYNLEATQKVINESLEELPPRCQEIFTLSRIEDVPNEEIAIKLGISKRSVENQVSLALKVIRRHLAALHIFSILCFLLYL